MSFVTGMGSALSVRSRVPDRHPNHVRGILSKHSCLARAHSRNLVMADATLPDWGGQAAQSEGEVFNYQDYRKKIGLKGTSDPNVSFLPSPLANRLEALASCLATGECACCFS